MGREIRETGGSSSFADTYDAYCIDFVFIPGLAPCSEQQALSHATARTHSRSLVTHFVLTRWLKTGRLLLVLLVCVLRIVGDPQTEVPSS